MAEAEEGTLWPTGASAASIKFSFSRTTEQRPLADTDDSEWPSQAATDPVSGSSTNTEALVDMVLSQAVKELTENSKKSLEEREKSGVDPMLANPMIQQECIPNQEVADSKPWAETVLEEAD
ncbi:g patch domain and kow [Lynx pardinus]|uniref:G patch domain and kow n=1 Tax=Lynx pardinus TaxID=191816 RepID=A0A485MWP5_LYNPA|nr:g patch domain and kow [Lynx pardinus]